MTKELKDKHYSAIVEFFKQDDIKQQGKLSMILKNQLVNLNNNFFGNLDINIKNITSFYASFIKIGDKPIIIEFNDDYVFFSDIEFIINNIYMKPPIPELKNLDIKKEMFIKITYYNYKNISDEQCEILNEDQYIIQLHFYKVKQKMDIDIIDKIRNIKQIEYNDRQNHTLSYRYSLEMYESLWSIYSFYSKALLNFDYSNNYKAYNINQNNSYNPHDIFKIYDREYLTNANLTIESLYKFWERLGFILFQFIKPQNNKLNDKNLYIYKFLKRLVFLVFQFIKPQNNKINDKNLSIQKLIKELKKDKNNKILQNTHFEWLYSTICKKDSYFDKLCKHRHPSTHYKYLNKGNSFGLLISNVLYKLEIAKENSDLIEIENDNKKLIAFLQEQIKISDEGYEHICELIKLIENVS